MLWTNRLRAEVLDAALKYGPVTRADSYIARCRPEHRPRRVHGSPDRRRRTAAPRVLLGVGAVDPSLSR